MEQDKSLREERKRHKAAKLKVVWTTHHKRERDDDDDAGPKNLSKKKIEFEATKYFRLILVNYQSLFEINSKSLIW